MEKKYLTDICTIEIIQPFLLENLPKITACLDTGYSYDETVKLIKTMYPKVDFSKTYLALHLIRRLYNDESENVFFLVKEQNKISFSSNWNNKLTCRYFTTIRIHNPNFYKLNEFYEIVLSKKAKI